VTGLKRYGIALCLIAAVLGALVGCGPKPPSPEESAPAEIPPASKPLANDGSAAEDAAAFSFIQINENGYSPKVISVPVGTKVTWSNHAKDARTVTFDSGPNSGQIEPGKSATHVFDEAGTFTYHDSANPEMTGSVQVKAKAK
jgi:plastocyanin